MRPGLAGRLSRFLAGCYPRRWRERYGAEMLEYTERMLETWREGEVREREQRDKAAAIRPLILFEQTLFEHEPASPAVQIRPNSRRTVSPNCVPLEPTRRRVLPLLPRSS